LFAVACCRRFDCLPDEETELAVNLAELFSDGWTSEEAVISARNSLYKLYQVVGPDQRYLVTYHACETRSPINTFGVVEGVIRGQSASRYYAGRITAEWDAVVSTIRREEGLALTTILRHLFGNPFRPASIDPTVLTWNGGTVPKLAQAIYDQRRFTDLPILADALEEAGCTDADILAHCRSEGPHVRGCWVVDLVLGKE
jgi:hypothetical protein